MKILLVEDEASLGDVLARNLRARHHDVTLAATADAALHDIAATPPDVLIIDVNLPDLTGWDILRRMSPDVRSSVRVIVISAAPISQKRIDEFRPARTLQKPFPIAALVRAIDEAAITSARQKREAT